MKVFKAIKDWFSPEQHTNATVERTTITSNRINMIGVVVMAGLTLLANFNTSPQNVTNNTTNISNYPSDNKQIGWLPSTAELNEFGQPILNENDELVYVAKD